MARTIAYIFGAILTIVGIWGFVQNPVFGLFQSNMAHSVVHLLTGLVLLFLAWSNTPRVGLKIFGVVYALIAIVGFIIAGDTIFGLIDNSVSDSILNTLLAIVFLWAGFMSGERVPMETSAPTQPSL
ncbi:DUF4383 domain-containing protein [Candidatus Parcubacteria bacterium]|nr:DUF4383 domain-containing protein [Candidatus Parcubacteria bacterium]